MTACIPVASSWPTASLAVRIPGVVSATLITVLTLQLNTAMPANR
jgi:hypothetical protein